MKQRFLNGSFVRIIFLLRNIICGGDSDLVAFSYTQTSNSAVCIIYSWTEICVICCGFQTLAHTNLYHCIIMKCRALLRSVQICATRFVLRRRNFNVDNDLGCQDLWSFISHSESEKYVSYCPIAGDPPRGRATGWVFWAQDQDVYASARNLSQELPDHRGPLSISIQELVQSSLYEC